MTFILPAEYIVKAIRTASRCIKILCASLALSLPVLAAVEDNTILALEPEEGMVVVKTAAGTLEVITIGDAFPGSDVIVKQVLADKVIAEEVINADVRTRQQVWVYKAKNADAGSRVERLLLSLPDDGVLVPAETGLGPHIIVLDQPGESQ